MNCLKILEIIEFLHRQNKDFENLIKTNNYYIG